jgi:hypothetical protein
MNRLLCLIASSMALTIMVALASVANAATITPQVLVNFDGTLSGTTYSLGAGELDNSGTFSASGMASVAGGFGDVPGDVDSTSGFYFDAGLGGLGMDLQTTNWISEALVWPDVPASQQPTHGADSGGARNNHILGVQGDTFYRFQGESPDAEKITEFGYWDGATEQRVQVANLKSNKPNHVALVWDAADTRLDAYYNGLLRGSVDLGAFDVSSPYVGYGFFARYVAQPGVGGRAIDGSLDAVAFSTYDGAFDPANDFQLPVVPEPSSFLMVSFVLAALRWPRNR